MCDFTIRICDFIIKIIFYFNFLFLTLVTLVYPVGMTCHSLREVRAKNRYIGVHYLELNLCYTDHSENLQLYLDRSGAVMLTGHSVDE